MTVTSSLTMQEQDIKDPLEEMLKKTGCMEMHYQVQVLRHVQRSKVYNVT